MNYVVLDAKLISQSMFPPSSYNNAIRTVFSIRQRCNEKCKRQGKGHTKCANESNLAH